MAQQALLRPFSLPTNAVAKPTKHGASPRPRPTFSTLAAGAFKSGSPHAFWITLNKRKFESRATSISVRCEQGAKQDNGLDVWLGRLAMVGFATAITVEISTGKGLLENFGFITPLPTLALAVTALIGVLAAFFIFQSASRE